MSELIRAPCAVALPSVALCCFFGVDYCVLNAQNPLVGDQALSFKKHCLLEPLLMVLCLNI